MDEQKTDGQDFGVLISSLALAALLAGCGGNKAQGGGSGTTTTVNPGANSANIATVNGEAVSREDLRNYLEAQGGESALSKLIEYSLVMQEAKKQGVNISDADVQANLDSRRASDPTVDIAQKNGGAQLDALQRQARYQIALDGLLTKDVKVDDAAFQKWFASHGKTYDQPERVKFGFLLSSTKARADTMAAQLKSKTKTFQELVDEQKKASDRLGQGSQAESPSYTPTPGLPKAVKTAVAGLKKDENSSVLTLGKAPRQAFAIVRLVDKQPAVKADMTKMKVQLQTDYKLEQVARGLNGQNPKNPDFDKTVTQITGYLAQQSGGATPSYRQVLDFVNQTAVANLVSKLQAAAQVEIQDKAYERVGEQFKAMAAANAKTPPAGASTPGASSAPPAAGAPTSSAPAASAPKPSTPAKAPAKP